MHADVIGDSYVTASLYRDGRFIMHPRPESADPADYTLPPASDGELLKLHGPFVPTAGAAVMAFMSGGGEFQNAYLALRIVSLLAGMLVILFSFFVTTRLVGHGAGLAVAAWIAASFFLIDYSGNGSLYISQSALYLAWLLVSLNRPFPLRGFYTGSGRVLLLALLSGIGYLVNYQCMILTPATLVILAVQERSWRRFFGHAAVFLAAVVLIIFPWLVRNTLAFGDPFYGHAYNMAYVYGKAGVSFSPETLKVSFYDWLGILHAVFTLWLPNNLYYAARKLFILAPIAFFLFSYGLIDIVFSRKRFMQALPVLLLLTLQMLMYAGWPIWKFRFFAPVLPIVFILAAEELWHLRVSPAMRNALAGVTLAAIIVMSVLAYRAIPTHTTYYDGALTQDPFHSSEELTYLRKFHLIPSDDAP